MRIAIVGSRNLLVENFDTYITEQAEEIVSGGAKGVDKQAAEYAKRKHIKLTEFLPEYNKYGKSAPLKRNQKIAEYADECIAFWDGASKGTLYTINCFKKLNKRIQVIIK